MDATHHPRTDRPAHADRALRTTGGHRTPVPVEALGTILSIWAHPDDESFLAAGVMAAARAGGQRVVCATATAGERGTPDPDTWPPERLGRVRRWEAAAAMAVLDVREHVVLGLPDGGLPHHEAEGRAWAEQLLGEVRPDTILTFGPEGMTYHPDHIAVHRWVTTAWHRRGRPGRLLHAAPTVERLARFADLFDRWDMYMTDERPAGVPSRELDVHLCLVGSLLDRKVAALRAMATQTAGLFASADAATLEALVREECFVAAEAGAATAGGRTAGVGRAAAPAGATGASRASAGV